ncbi:YxeA family protein [Bifidobacterium pullorum subsp. gallinarum]
MKKVMIFGGILAALLIGFIIFIQNVNINRLGTDQYYVQIQEGTRVEDKSDDGKKYTYYEYTLEGFDKEGAAKTLTFTAQKELRKEAYLRVYVKKSGVGSYQEVQANELPEQARAKLEMLEK